MLGLNEVERRENEVASPADIRALRQLRTRLTEMEKEVVRQHERKLQVGSCCLAELKQVFVPWVGWASACIKQHMLHCVR